MIRAFSICLWFTLFSCSGASNPNNVSNNSNNANNSNNGTSNNGNNSNNSDASYDGLAINEVAAVGDPDDWIELYNGASHAIVLDGLTISDDPDDPQQASLVGTMEPGAFAIVTVSEEAIGFKLGSEETVGVFRGDQLIDGVTWVNGDAPEGRTFGRIPDGTGDFKTLLTPSPGAANIDNDPNIAICNDGVIGNGEVCDRDDYGGEDCLSLGLGGEIACAQDCRSFDVSSCIPAIVLNEVTSSGDDSIELYNIGDFDADISGWYVVDDAYTPGDANQRYDFPADTVVPSNGFLVLTGGDDHPFGVGANDSLRLYDGEDNLIDQVAWPDGDAVVSFCRIPNGTGAFQSCGEGTFGDENAP